MQPACSCCRAPPSHTRLHGAAARARPLAAAATAAHAPGARGTPARQHRRLTQPPPLQPLICRHRATSAAARASPTANGSRTSSELADRVREVWDDEEDVAAAVSRLGYDRDSLAAEGGPLLADVNELYVEQRYPQEGFLAQLELRYMPGKGYGLVARQAIPAGSLLAVCLPLAWVSGPPGQPPPLEALVTLLRGHRGFTPQQRRVLEALCSTPALDDAHDGELQQQQHNMQQDAVLRAAADLQSSSAAPGLPAGSLPQSKAAALARAQRQLKAQSGLRSLRDDDDGDEQEEGEGESDPRDASSSQRQQQLLGSGSSNSRIGSGALRQAARGLPAAADSYRVRRRMPDLLDFLECTKPADDDNSSTAGAGAAPPAPRGLFNALSKLGSSATSASSASSSAALAAARAGPLGMSLERLSSLVCRNALFELSQDLVTASIRGEQPASLAGIWPLLTLFNHSCAPNSVAVTIGHQPPPPPKQPASLLGAAQQQQARLGGSGRGPVNPWAVQAAWTQPGGGSSGSSRSSSSGGAQLATADAGLTFCAQPGRGPFVLVRSVTDLKPGDEVSLDYLSAGIEGSLVHQERRRAALAERWGFTCRCERCEAEQQLGRAISRTVQATNALTSRLGPKVATALNTAAVAAAATAATSASHGAPAPPSSSSVASQLIGQHEQVLHDVSARLSAAVEELEQQVDGPSIPPRVGAWAHASMYQAHALLAVAEYSLQPSNLQALACIGTAAELAGFATAGSPVHLLAMARLVCVSADAWGPDDARVDAALHAMLAVVQARYGPLKAGVASLLSRSAQRWVHATETMPLALLSPAAAAAVQARKQLARAATKQQQEQEQEQQDAAAGPTSTTAAAAPAQAAAAAVSSDEDEYGMAAELALDADEVFEVPDDEDASSLFAEGAAAAGVDDADDGEVLIRQRSEADVRAGLRAFEGMRQTLPPEQRQQQQYGPTTAARADEGPQDTQQQQRRQQAGAAAGSTGLGALSGCDADASGADAAEDEALEQELPLLTSWLQGGPPAATAPEPDQQQPSSPAAPAADRPRRAPSAGTQRPRQSAVQSVFAGKGQAGQQERQKAPRQQAGSSRRPRRAAKP